MELGFDGPAPAYKPGDALDLYPENDPRSVDEILKLTGLAADDTLRHDLTGARDITAVLDARIRRRSGAPGRASRR